MTDSPYRFVPSYGYSVTERIVVYEDRDFEASYHWTMLEDGREMAFFHLDVTNMTPASLKRMIRAWNAWRPTLPHHLFTQGEAETPSYDRWVRKMGFIPVLVTPCTDEIDRTLYVSLDK